MKSVNFIDDRKKHFTKTEIKEQKGEKEPKIIPNYHMY